MDTQLNNTKKEKISIVLGIVIDALETYDGLGIDNEIKIPLSKFNSKDLSYEETLNALREWDKDIAQSIIVLDDIKREELLYLSDIEPLSGRELFKYDNDRRRNEVYSTLILKIVTDNPIQKLSTIRKKYEGKNLYSIAEKKSVYPIICGELKLDLDKVALTYKDKTITDFNPASEQIKLLEIFMLNPETLLSYEEIFSRLRPWDNFSNEPVPKAIQDTLKFTKKELKKVGINNVTEVIDNKKNIGYIFQPSKLP